MVRGRAIPGTGSGINPFQSIDEIKTVNPPIAKIPIVPAQQEANLPEYTVSAILYGANGNRAILDARIVRIGDTVGRETVKEIKPGIVVLEHEGKTRELLIRNFEEAVRRTAPKGEKP
jgi:hypothetical protein